MQSLHQVAVEEKQKLYLNRSPSIMTAFCAIVEEKQKLYLNKSFQSVSSKAKIVEEKQKLYLNNFLYQNVRKHDRS